MPSDLRECWQPVLHLGPFASGDSLQGLACFRGPSKPEAPRQALEGPRKHGTRCTHTQTALVFEGSRSQTPTPLAEPFRARLR
jgi:hypothetical protein